MQETRESGGWTGKRILLGIGIGCGALILLVVIAVSVIGYWAYMPGEQVETSLILDRDSVAVFRLEKLGEDPGVESLLRLVFTEAKKIQAEQAKDLPPAARWWVGFQRGYSERDLERLLDWLPREVTATLETVPDSEEVEPVFAINLARFPRMIRFLVSMAGDGPNQDREQVKVAFVESTLVAASPHVLDRTMVRVNDPLERTRVDPELLGAFESVDPRWDFHGVLLNRHDLLSRWAREEAEAPLAEAPPESYEDIVKVSFGIDLVSEQEAVGQLVIDCRDEEKARALLSELAGKVETQLKELGLEPETSIERNDNLVTLGVRVANLKEALVEGLRKGAEEARRKSEEGG